MFFGSVVRVVYKHNYTLVDGFYVPSCVYGVSTGLAPSCFLLTHPLLVSFPADQLRSFDDVEFASCRYHTVYHWLIYP